MPDVPALATQRSVGRGRRARWSFLVAGAAVAGLMLRVGAHATSLGAPDADEAVWGLMARHAFDGGFSAFFWGQGYGGTAEVLLTSPLVAALGTGSLAIRAVPIVLGGVAALLVWVLGRRIYGEPAATAAGLLVWVWPPFLVWKSVRAHGFHASSLVAVLVVLLLVHRIAERPRRIDVALLGLALGICWWLTPQTMTIAVPALAWLTWRRRSVWRDAWVAAPAFLLGSAPWFVSNLRHDWWSLQPDWGDTTYLERLRVFASSTFPMELGVRVPFTSEWLGGPVVGIAAYLSLLGALVWLGRRSPGTTLTLATVCLVLFPFLAALSPYAWLTDEPRYVLLLTPVLALLFARPVRGSACAATLVAVGAALSAAVLGLMARSPAFEARADGLSVPRSLRSLVTELEHRGVDRLFADYWVAYRLDFESAERLTAAEARLLTVRRRGGTVPPDEPVEPTDVRHLPYDRAVRRLGTPPYVAVARTADDEHLSAVLAGAGYRRILAGGFALYLPPAAGR